MSARLVWVAMIVAMVGCADDRLAGKGAASETTNGVVLEGRVVRSDGSAAARVLVKLGSPMTDSVVSRDVTDDSGAYALVAPTTGRYLVQTFADSIASVQWVSVGSAARQKLETTVQARLSSLRGRVVGDVGDPTTLRIRVPSLGLEAPVGRDSSWSVAGVAAGWHLAQVVRVGGVVEGEMTASTYVQNVFAVSSRIFATIDDFEADQGQGRLVHLLDGSWWGRWNDTSMLADSSRTWAGTSGLATDSSAWNGRSMRVPMLVGSAIAQRPDLDRSAGVLIKIGGREDLDSQSVWFDLTKIDSIVFMAKGSGTVVFQIKARSVADRFNIGYFRKSIALPSGWTRISLPPAALVADSGLDWKQAQVRELLWTTHDTRVDLWLDDIELVGIRPTDLLRR